MAKIRTSVGRWIWLVIRDGVLSWDLVLGLVAGLVFTYLADRYPKEIGDNVGTVLLGLIPLSLALLTFLVSQHHSFMGLRDDVYDRIIDRVGGIDQVLLPIRIATTAAIALLLYSFLSRITLPLASPFASSVLLCVGVGGFVWVSVGAWQVYRLVDFHGRQHYQLHRSVREAQDIVDQRRADLREDDNGKSKNS
jgi:hypothetical protein